MSEKRLIELPVAEILVESNIRRTADDQLGVSLAATVKQRGVLQPVTVYERDGRFVLLHGHRRLEAAKLAELASVPAFIVPAPIDGASRVVLQLVENIQRQDLSVYEKAIAYASLLKHGVTLQALSADIGSSPSNISKHVALLSLPAEQLELVRAGKIGLRDAYDMKCIKDPEAQAAFARRIIGDTSDRGATSEQAKVRAAEESPTSAPKRSRVEAVLPGQRTVTVSASEITLESMHGTVRELAAKIRKAMQQGLELDAFLRVLKQEAKTARAPNLATA